MQSLDAGHDPVCSRQTGANWLRMKEKAVFCNLYSYANMHCITVLS